MPCDWRMPSRSVLRSSCAHRQFSSLAFALPLQRGQPTPCAAFAQRGLKQINIAKEFGEPLTIYLGLVTSKEATMTIRSLALGGLTTLLLTFSAAASISAPTRIDSPLAAQPVAHH